MKPVVEKLIYHQWFHRVMKQSIYAPTQVQDDDKSYLTCPGCGAAHKDIPHDSTIVCDCGLYMHRLGNALRIWKE